MIAELEDAVIQAATSVLGDHVRTIESLPGQWSLDLLRRMFQQAPAVYIAWLGGKARDNNQPILSSRLDVLAVTKNARGEKARRRGDPNSIGAYQILEAIVPKLHGLDVADIGSLELVDVSNVFNEATFELGATVYAAQFRVPVNLTAPVDLAGLAKFETFHDTRTIGDATDEQNVDLSSTWT